MAAEYPDVTDPNEVLSPEYQAFLDSLPPLTEEEIEQMAYIFGEKDAYTYTR